VSETQPVEFSRLRDSRMCGHKPRGRSENRIFGNDVFPKNGGYQIPFGLLLFEGSCSSRNLRYAVVRFCFRPVRLEPLAPLRVPLRSSGRFGELIEHQNHGEKPGNPGTKLDCRAV
jgi:hypothetical protein